MALQVVSVEIQAGKTFSAGADSLLFRCNDWFCISDDRQGRTADDGSDHACISDLLCSDAA